MFTNLARTFILVAAFSSGCSQSKSIPTSSPHQPIRLQLNWLPDAQFGGYYAAKLAGDYRKEGLDVEIIIGGPGAAVLPKLAMGRADFGIGNADQLLLARQEGADVMAIMAVMQDSPRCIMVHESSGIESFEQLQNLTLALGEGKSFAQYMKDNLPLDGVRIVSYAGNVAKFLIDKEFAQQAYVFSEPVVARNRGSDPRALMVSQLGFNPYAGIVMAPTKLVKTQPKVVAKFVKATRRGWLRYLESPAAANAEINRLNEEADLASLATAVDVLKPLCLNADSVEPDEQFGTMTAARWQTLADQLVKLGLLKQAPANIQDLFTSQFVVTPILSTGG